MPCAPHRRAAASVRAAAMLLLLAACTDRTPVGLAPDAAPAPAPRGAVGPGFDGRIRIGVVPAASVVTVGSAAAYTVADRATGATLLAGAGGTTAAVTLESGSLSTTRYRLQVMCGAVAAVATREAAARALGHPTLTEPVPASNCTRLYIGDYASNAAFGVRNTYRNLLIAQGLSGTDSFWKLVTTTTGTIAYRVAQGAQLATSSGPVVLTADDGVVSINGVRYRGAAEVRMNAAGTLAGVNVVPMEDYLRGVVPAELSPRLWPELEALKAQAVAARTYALSGLGKRASDGYDLLPTTADQVYAGVSAEQELSDQAVAETRAVVATYDGRLISALFSSTSGGHTASNEESFASEPVPYLRGLPDAQRGQAVSHVPSLEVFRAHANATSLRAAREGDFESDWSSRHRWTFEWSAEEISRVISAYATGDVGRVREINVLERGPSGRVLRIEYVTDAGTYVDTRDRIRSSLRYVTASGQLGNLWSTLFYVEPVVDAASGETTGFRAYGGGFGHGVGLSQTGAVGMAEKRHTYDEILRHYYQGIALETVNY